MTSWGHQWHQLILAFLSPNKHLYLIQHLLIHPYFPSSSPWTPRAPCVSPPCPSECGGPAWPWRSFPCRWSWADGSCRCAAARRSRRRWSSCTGHPASGWTGWWPCLSGWPPATHAGRKRERGGVKESSSSSSWLAKDLQEACLYTWSTDGPQR